MARRPNHERRAGLERGRALDLQRGKGMKIREKIADWLLGWFLRLADWLSEPVREEEVFRIDGEPEQKSEQ